MGRPETTVENENKSPAIRRLMDALNTDGRAAAGVDPEEAFQFRSTDRGVVRVIGRQPAPNAIFASKRRHSGGIVRQPQLPGLDRSGRMSNWIKPSLALRKFGRELTSGTSAGTADGEHSSPDQRH